MIYIYVILVGGYIVISPNMVIIGFDISSYTIVYLGKL